VDEAMQNVTDDLRGRRKKIEQESLLRQIHSTLDSLGNDLIGMLWMMHLSLAALQETPDIDQAKNHLQNGLRAGESAKNLMRLILNSWKI
jgi:hypothetical protein